MSNHRQPNNRVLVELEAPQVAKGKPFDHELGAERARLATNLLRRMGVMGDAFEWNQRHLRYAYVYSGGGGYEILNDNSRWFNLDYLGRDLDQAEAA